MLTRYRGVRILVKVQRIILMVSNISTAALISAAALSREIFHLNIYSYDEVLIVFAFWLYFFGAANGSYENSHIKADIVYALVKNIKIKAGVGIGALVVTTAVNAVLVYWGLIFLSWAIVKNPVSTGLDIPVAVPQSAILIGLSLMLLYHVLHLIDHVKNYRNKDDSEGTEGTENVERTEEDMG
jgi:TRAP-type C4-dicarboxylate transport system permease small subunit